MFHLSVLFSVTLMLALAFPFKGQAQDSVRGYAIATGGPNGVYYPTGLGLCRAILKDRKNKLPCEVLNSKGSVDNIERLRSGEVNFGIVQADTLYYALNGYGPFKGKKPLKSLRTVLSLYTEAFIILARKDSGIRTFDDLKGKRVNIGNPGSGQRASMDLVMLMKGWKKDVFAQAYEFTSSEISGAICDDKVDAIVYVIANPNDSIQKAVNACETVLVNAYDPQIKKMIAKFPYIEATRIRGGTYRGIPETTLTFGIKASLVTTDETFPERVSDLIKYLFYDYSDFLYSHTAFQDLTRERLAPTDEIAPLHFAAEGFF